jgi:hypothetical protein
MSDLYHVRQYHPSYCDFEDAVAHNIAYDKILECSWFRNFEHNGGFEKFVIEPYARDELIISACYKNGKHWVAGFAIPITSKAMSPNGDLMVNNWRYNPK